MKFVIWSFKHNAWWGPYSSGYVQRLEDAGRYDGATAGRIVINSIMLESVAIVEALAEENGPPKFHVYDGAVEEQGQGD